MRVSWKEVIQIHNLLGEKLEENSKMEVRIILGEKKYLQKIFSFKKFYEVMWSIYSQETLKIQEVFFLTKEGKILYTINREKEEKPKNETNKNIIPKWKSMQQKEKEQWLRILISEISSWRKNIRRVE